MKKLSVNKIILSEEEIETFSLVQRMARRIVAEYDLPFEIAQKADDIQTAIDTFFEDCLCENELRFMVLDDYCADEMSLEISDEDTAEENED